MCFRPATVMPDKKCPKCGAYRLPHRLCKSCMTYNGRTFAKVNVTEAKAD